MAAALIDVLGNDEGRAQLVAAGTEAVQRYDWSVVAQQIMLVYETVTASGARVKVDSW